MMRRILAAVDASPRAPDVLEAAQELGARFGAEVTLLRVIAIPQDFPPSAAHGVDPLPREVEQSAAEELRQLAAGHPELKLEPPLVYAGQPWRAIVERAEKLEVDLIVIGSHGYRGWDRILGTTAGKVVNHAGRDVLVVHEKKKR